MIRSVVRKNSSDGRWSSQVFNCSQAGLSFSTSRHSHKRNTISRSRGVTLPPYFPTVPPKTQRPYPSQPDKQGRALRARTHPFPFGAAASVRDLARLADWCEVRSGRNTQEKRRHKQHATPHAEDRESVKRAHILESGQLWRKHYGQTRRSARPLR